MRSPLMPRPPSARPAGRRRSLRPQARERPHRLAAVPAFRRFADLPEHAALRARDLRQLDYGSGMVFGIEIDEAAALADLAAHLGLEALGQQAPQVGIVVLGPVGHVLQAGA